MRTTCTRLFALDRIGLFASLECKTDANSVPYNACQALIVLWQGLAAGLLTCVCSVGNWLPSIKERAGGIASAK